MRTSRLKPRLVPALLVRDMSETLAFYRKLGFELTSFHPDQERDTWAEADCDGVVLQFHTKPSSGTPPVPVCSGTFHFFPRNIGALADEFARCMEFAWGPEMLDYGMREFGVQDPNGYYLAFTEPAWQAITAGK